MSRIKIPGVGASEGMREMSNFVFPPGNYLLKVTDIETRDKEGVGGAVIGTTFQVKSEVLGAENLPASENVRDLVGKTYVDFIFVMSPDHPSYANETKIGGIVGEIGISQLKSFLDATGVKIKNDEFDEKKAIGSWIEVRVGSRTYKDKDGNDRTSNQVYEYTAHVDEKAVAESTPDEVEFDDDDLLD